MSAILLIDDNEAYCQQIQKTLALRNYELQYETNPYKALEIALSREWDIILLDIVFYQDLEGLEILEKIKSKKPDLPVIMVSAASTLQTAVEAVEKGAFDYLEKPINVERMTMTIEHALSEKRLKELNWNLFNEFYKSVATNTLSKTVQQISDLLAELNEPLERILLFGEKGTGKELLSKVLHFKSARKYGPFVSFYCHGQNAERERQLFGVHNGPNGQRTETSLIHKADKGTLFIGEISELSTQGQKRLMQFIHENYYMPSSTKMESALNIRLIVSTSVELKPLVDQGLFSDELFNLLNTFTFRLPPLRERPEDIPLLADHFLTEMNINNNVYFTKDAVSILQSYPWPGNISELKTVIWLLSFFHRHSEIDTELVQSVLQFYEVMKDLREGKLETLADRFKEFYELYGKALLQDAQSIK